MLPEIEMEILNEYGPNSLLLKVGEHRVILDAVELDELVEQLSALRSDILPETPSEPSPTHQYVIETAPHWQTACNPLLDGLIVFLRHSGYGWAGFGMPRASIERLAEIIAPFVAPPAAITTRRVHI